MNNRLKFDRQFFKDFWNLFKPYWLSKEKLSAFGLLAGMIISMFILVRMKVDMNNFNKEFFDGLQAVNKHAIIHSIIYFGVIVVIMATSDTYVTYFSNYLSIRWQRWLTHNTLDKWLTNHKYYNSSSSNKLDNPDQRISNDLELFPDSTINLFNNLVNCLISLVSFGVILWQLSEDFYIPIGKTHFNFPGYLVWAALTFAIVGTYITNFIGKKLSSLEYNNQWRNADFRFALIRVRENGEQIALSHGEMVEKNKLNLLFSHIYGNYKKILSTTKNLGFFTNGYVVITGMIGMFIAVPAYLQGSMQMGTLMQISHAFGEVIFSCSMLVSKYSDLVQWRAVIQRLIEFKSSLENKPHSEINISRHDSKDILLKNLKLKLPTDKILFNDISLNFKAGESYLLTGNSGLGKSTFLRAIAGIWKHGNGQVHMPDQSKIMFLPQKTYLPIASFKELITYPADKSNEHDISQIIKDCDLHKYAMQLDEVKDWSRELSLGEQQRVTIARVLLHKPDILFLDETTSSLDEATENTLYTLIRKTLPDATIISVGHRSSLHQYHDNIIDMSVFVRDEIDSFFARSGKKK